MTIVLQLQKLIPAANQDATAPALMSTYSGICPTGALSGETMQFEME